MVRRFFFAVSVLAATMPCFGQNTAIDSYVRDINSAGEYSRVANASPDERDAASLRAILPAQKSSSFANYVIAKTPVTANGDLSALLKDVDALRMNKQLGSSGGSTGITSLLSNVAGPSLIGLGVEYGAIQQNTTGNTTTLRANLLGVSRVLLGEQQFSYCPEIDQKHCEPVSRWLRHFSGNVSFENTNNTTGTGTATAVNSTTPTPVDLFGNGFRMSSWGARFDFTATDPADPGFLDRFKDVVQQLRNDQSSADLTKAVNDLFNGSAKDAYNEWLGQTLPILKNAATPDQFKSLLDQQLNALVTRLKAANGDFLTKIIALRRASESYFAARDKRLQDIQSRRFSLEYTNLHALNQPTTSNLRFIFSHQPTAAPLLITANAAMTWYNSIPTGATTGRLRDVQAAAKIDRRLGMIPNLGNAVLTVGGYYQWMKEDALIEIGPGNVAPGSGIVLPGTAATLLGTKGSIGIVQGRVTVPLNNTIKIPLSLTWSNRTELIKESDTRGQIGVTFDIDSLFR
jgi:hypothetical protein